jgi:hypothetical protein
MNPVHTLLPYFPKIHSNIIFPTTPWSYERSLPFRYSGQNFVCISYLSCVLYAPPTWWYLIWSLRSSSSNETRVSNTPQILSLRSSTLCKMESRLHLETLKAGRGDTQRNRSTNRCSMHEWIPQFCFATPYTYTDPQNWTVAGVAVAAGEKSVCNGNTWMQLAFGRGRATKMLL